MDDEPRITLVVDLTDRTASFVEVGARGGKLRVEGCADNYQQLHKMLIETTNQLWSMIHDKGKNQKESADSEGFFDEDFRDRMAVKEILADANAQEEEKFLEKQKTEGFVGKMFKKLFSRKEKSKLSDEEYTGK